MIWLTRTSVFPNPNNKNPSLFHKHKISHLGSKKNCKPMLKIINSITSNTNNNDEPKFKKKKKTKNRKYTYRFRTTDFDGNLRIRGAKDLRFRRSSSNTSRRNRRRRWDIEEFGFDFCRLFGAIVLNRNALRAQNICFCHHIWWK